MSSCYRVALLSYHPMPYHVAFYRALHRHPRIAEHVFYLDDFGIKFQLDPEFSQDFCWDNEILADYDSIFLKNYSWNKHKPLISRINPGVIWKILATRYDAVVIDYANLSTWFAYLTALLSRTPIIMRTESDLDRPYKSFLTILKRRFLALVLRGCAAVLYSCEKNRSYFLSFGVPEEKLFPLLSSVDNDFYLQAAAQRDVVRNKLRTRYAIPLDASVVMFSGRLIKRKNALDLLAAYQRVHANNHNLFLIYVGDGPQRGLIEQRIQDHGLDQVIITGFINQSDLWKYYHIADIFVMPSEWDPTPKSLHEAAISGLACIISDTVGQANDLVIHGENGFVFPAGDIHQLTRYLSTLSNDATLRNNFALRLTQHVRAWSPEKNALGLLAALDYIHGA